MTNVLRIKRRAAGGAAGAPAALANAELAFNEQDNVLYYGTGTGGAGGTATQVIAIAGPGAFVSSQTSQSANTVLAAPNGASGAPSFRALAAADIPSLTAAKISDFDTQVRASRLDQMAAPTADVSLSGHKLTNLSDPTSAQDAATKAYVDGVAQGISFKTAVRVATTANIALSGTQTIDGIAVGAGDRVLVKNQTTQADNGIYIAAAGAWSRAADMDAWSEVPGAFVFIEEGASQADTGWVCTADPGGTLGSTAITWTQFNSAGSYSAGNGLQLTGSVFSVLANGGTITVSASGIKLSDTYAGQSTITTLGTIGTGAWQGATIGVAYGGTGAATLTGLVKGNGTSAFTAAVAGTDYLDPGSTIDGGTF